MNGRPWLQCHTDTLLHFAGQCTDAELASKTGHAVSTVRKRRTDLGLPGYRGRSEWTRRDWLLHTITGLDFQISLWRR